MEVERRGGEGAGRSEPRENKGGGGWGGVGGGGMGGKGGGKEGIHMFQNLDYVSGVHAVRSRNCTITNEREPEILCRYVYSLKAAQVAYNKAGLPS